MIHKLLGQRWKVKRPIRPGDSVTLVKSIAEHNEVHDESPCLSAASVVRALPRSLRRCIFAIIVARLVATAIHHPQPAAAPEQGARQYASALRVTGWARDCWRDTNNTDVVFHLI